MGISRKLGAMESGRILVAASDSCARQERTLLSVDANSVGPCVFISLGRRTCEARVRIAVVASTNTWNAYNNFGGRSNYVNADHLPDRPLVNARQDLDRYQDERRSELEAEGRGISATILRPSGAAQPHLR